jgi:hypothetical protein
VQFGRNVLFNERASSSRWSDNEVSAACLALTVLFNGNREKNREGLNARGEIRKCNISAVENPASAPIVFMVNDFLHFESVARTLR